MSQPYNHRRPMRRGDTFRVVAIDDERLDRERLAHLAAAAIHPRCAFQAYAVLGPDLLAALSPEPHLVILDDHLGPECSGETAIAWLREQGYSGPIAILSGLQRPQRNPELVRAGAMIYLSKDDLGPCMFYDMIDMAMALSGIMRNRRGLTTEPTPRPPGQERRKLEA